MDKSLKSYLTSKNLEKSLVVYKLFQWMFRTRMFDYMSMGFILFQYEDTMNYWRSCYYIGHLTCFFFIILGYLLKKGFKKYLNEQRE
jgi:hypothetical protein